METLSFLDLFQGIATLAASEPKIMIGRIFLMLLGFLLLMVIGGAEDLTVIFLGGLAGLSLMLLGGWLGHAFYGQEKDAEWLRRERDEDVF